MRMFDFAERCVLALFVRLRFARSMDSNTLRRSLNLFEFPHSSFAFSFYHSILVYCKSHRPKAVTVATQMRPCIVLYKTAGNPREICD